MQAIGDQGLRAAEKAHHDLQDREHQIDPHADPGGFFGIEVALAVMVRMVGTQDALAVV